jgi:hypothetical protein
MLFGWANPVMLQDALRAGVALMDQVRPDPTEAVRKRDCVRVNPKAERVEVWRREIRVDTPYASMLEAGCHSFDAREDQRRGT